MIPNGSSKQSLRRKLIRLFLVTSAIPILTMSLFSFYNIAITLKENSDTLTKKNLEQIGNNLHISLEAYEDLLYQIYTDDDVVQLVDNLNADIDTAVTINQLRRYIQGLLNTKNYIRSISIITSEGRVITYDQLTKVTNENSWLKNYSLSEKQLYERISSDNATHILPLEYGTTFANEDFYLLHIAHRIIDYKELTKHSGVVIVSLDEHFLRSICMELGGENSDMDSFSFLVDETGRLISFPEQEPLAKQITNSVAAPEERQHTYTDFVREHYGGGEFFLSLSVYHDNQLGWDIVNVSNRRAAMQRLLHQLEILLLVSGASVLAAVGLTLLLSRQLSDSIRQVVETMRLASGGDMTARVRIDTLMPVEIESIARQFNDMIGKLDQSIQNEKAAGERQRIAEIKALEAQINPHFLYNTLDTINWMAIERDEFDISNTISSLANILRYAITDSNEMVFIRDEIEWLKKYIFLQQKRLLKEFQCRIEADPEVMSCKIYKLLLQPFVENAIIHGFKGEEHKLVLKVRFFRQEDRLHIVIEDNGRGMAPELVNKLNRQNHPAEGHIGLNNVLSRLHIYYGSEAGAFFQSVEKQGTQAHIFVPWRR